MWRPEVQGEPSSVSTSLPAEAEGPEGLRAQRAGARGWRENLVRAQDLEGVPGVSVGVVPQAPPS